MKWTFLAFREPGFPASQNPFWLEKSRDSCVVHAWEKEGWGRQCCLRDGSLATPWTCMGVLEGGWGGCGAVSSNPSNGASGDGFVEDGTSKWGTKAGR